MRASRRASPGWRGRVQSLLTRPAPGAGPGGGLPLVRARAGAPVAGSPVAGTVVAPGTATGGVGSTYTWNVTGLPGGLTFDPATGRALMHPN